MEGLSLLLLLCACMWIGAYLAGLAPLSLALSPSRLKPITLFGAGLLVGTALIVIIPEGVNMHYAALIKEGDIAHTHDRRLNVMQNNLELTRPSILHEETSWPSQKQTPSMLSQVAAIFRVPKDRAAMDPVAHARVVEQLPAGRTLRSVENYRNLKLAKDRPAPAEEAKAEEMDTGDTTTEPAPDAEGHDHTHEAGHWHIGAALALGFAFQVIVGKF